MDAILVKEYRADIVECVHRGHISIVNDRGKVTHFAGDPHYVSFTRSAAKPFQAIPGIRAGIAEHYGLNEREIAVMTASHRSEHIHIDTLETLAKDAGLAEQSLVCAPSYPLDPSAKEELLRSGGHERRLYHNCSGKHLGVLAYSKMMGYPMDTYADPSHPVQREILDTFSSFTGVAPQQIGRGTDGCGFPVFAVPISALATAYMKLACPDLIEDEATRTAVLRITSAMSQYPEWVGGTGRVDSVLMKDSNIIAKCGFKGIYCFALRKERIGICFKIEDGSEEEWGWVVRSILEQLGYDQTETLERLKQAFPHQITNDAGLEVGHAEAVFQLETAHENN
ncbi:asparaginase [Paenibacillus sp. CAA11]|uniref:asparaginase n=1 Tax=Paenibacillus sp. CAA11 TaxID=1532905 RepID=UPI000D3B1900|nr:asparaginase [Paenibacillus sp. CAA11]AWB45977.1 asparaginase [Paenibacillus sp. CAA11]